MTLSVFASDIDNTLTGGEPQALQRLGQKLNVLRRQGKLMLFLTTGRTLAEVLNGLEQEHLPQPDAIITQVGTEIYVPPFAVGANPLPEWDALLRQQYSRRQAETFLQGIEGAEPQPAYYNTGLKTSFYLDKAPHPEQAVEIIRQRAAEAGGYQVVWSSSRHLDILPAAAGKGKAIRFLIGFLELVPYQVITAGDSGNDRSMLDEFGRGIIVANAQPELQALKQAGGDTDFYFARKSYAAGVEEGLEYFGLL